MTTALPVTIIGGYLGAGKTTLVNHLLRHADGARLAVLVNEFGALPIDEDLIEAQGDDLISIAGGCICCSFGDDLTAALIGMADMIPPPDHVIIEASGVALPGSVASTIGLLDALRVDGVVVLGDCTTLRAQARDDYIGDTIERQLRDADLVVLTKTDLAVEHDVRDITDWLNTDYPNLRVVPIAQGAIPKHVVLGAFDRTIPYGTAPHHDADYTSIVLHPDAPLDAQNLALDLVSDSAGFGILRAKGYVDDVSGQRALIQIVGARTQVSFPAETGAVGLVCIGLRDALRIDDLAALTPDQAAR